MSGSLLSLFYECLFASHYGGVNGERKKKCDSEVSLSVSKLRVGQEKKSVGKSKMPVLSCPAPKMPKCFSPASQKCQPLPQGKSMRGMKEVK